MYYRLKEPWSFRGWKSTPYAIRAERGPYISETPLFLRKQPFLDLLSCNGEDDVDLSEFCEDARKLVEKLLEAGVLESSESPLGPPESYQRYRVFPSIYLDSVLWSITGACNFRCRHCLLSAPAAHHPQLPLEDCLHIVDEIAGAGVKRVDLTGGEPLVRRDFDKIVASISEHNMIIGVIFTNGSLLTESTLDILEKHGQKPTFQLSFDGLHHHDWLRGIDGAEEQANAALKLLKDRGFATIAAMCIHKGNRESLRETVNYLADMGVLSLRLNAPQTLGAWKQYADEYALSHEEVWETYREYIGHYFADGMRIGIGLDGYFSCKKGSTAYSIPCERRLLPHMDWSKVPYCESIQRNAYIGADGRLVPCLAMSDTVLEKLFPSVLDQHLGQLTQSGYAHDVTLTSIQDLLDASPMCAECEHLSTCGGGCMIAGITDEGDYLVPDPEICFFQKQVGLQAVRDVADAAILAAGLTPEPRTASATSEPCAR